MALSNAEKQQNYRTRRAAKEFSKIYLGDNPYGSYDEFIEAKLQEAFPAAVFNGSFTSLFDDCLEIYDGFYAGSDENFTRYADDVFIYRVEDMLEAWEQAEQESKNENNIRNNPG